MRPKHKWLVVLGLFWLAGCVGLLGYALYHRNNEKVLNAYALDSAATLIAEYLDRHQGAWPKSWDDLAATAERLRVEAPPAESAAAQGSVREELDSLRKRVRVNFEADPVKLLAEAGDAESPPWQVVSLRSGQTPDYQNRDPNGLILDRLRAQLGRPGAR